MSNSMEKLYTFTKQEEHEFKENKSAPMIIESYGNGLPSIHHRKCSICNTYSILNKCGYNLKDKT